MESKFNSTALRMVSIRAGEQFICALARKSDSESSSWRPAHK
jgi:hypothetical protein